MANSRRWRQSSLDVIVAIALSITAVIMLGVAGVLRRPDAWLTSVCVVASCALVAWRGRYPVAVAMVAGVCIAVPFHTSYAGAVNDSPLFLPVFVAVFLYAYSLGVGRRWSTALPGVLALIIGANLTDGSFNPLPEMLIIGPWIAGLVVAARRRTVELLALRARELDAERDVFAELSVRYERARIARELHDIVAHCVTLIVVQANAGERLAESDPLSAAEAFASISDATGQASAEVDRLVALLDTRAPATAPAGLRIVEELVGRAQSSGLRITYELSGECDSVCESSADTAYRLVQEAITNAVKHAPGSSMTIAMSGQEHDIVLEVINGPAAGRRSGLERAGGGHGLAGMRERATGCGGALEVGATPDGGWRIAATLPRVRVLAAQR